MKAALLVLIAALTLCAPASAIVQLKAPDGNGQVYVFTEEEMQALDAGIGRMAARLKELEKKEADRKSAPPGACV